MQKGFIRNEDLILENSNVDDLLDLSEKVKDFTEKLKSYKDSSMIALKGRFGIGKSTFLYQLEKEYIQDVKKLWFNFDAWKFPNRDNLWESFVIEFARSISPKTFDKTLRKIDGKTPTGKIEKFIDFASGIYGDIQNFNKFLNSSPATRTFEVQNILLDLINNLKKEEIYIIVEDIDRSGDKGIYFLETLNYFFKHNIFPEKRIKIIVPISNDSYEENKKSYYKFFDDFPDYQNPEYKLQKFCEEIFVDEITGRDSEGGFNGKEQITTRPRDFRILLEFLEGIFKYQSDNFTLRELKILLRSSNSLYLNLSSKYDFFDKSNFLICILVTYLKFIYHDTQKKNSYFQYSKNQSKFHSDALGNALLAVIYGGKHSIYENHFTKDKLISLSHYVSGGIEIRKFKQEDLIKYKIGLDDKYLSDLYFIN